MDITGHHHPLYVRRGHHTQPPKQNPQTYFERDVIYLQTRLPYVAHKKLANYGANKKLIKNYNCKKLKMDLRAGSKNLIIKI